MEWIKKHKVLSAVIGVVLLIAVAGAGTETDTSNTSTNTQDSANTEQTEESQSSDESSAKIGEPARDGKFEFTVSKIDCGNKTLGGEFGSHDAQGEFCLVDIKVKNIGNEAQSLLADNQYAYNAQNQRYSADSEASFYLDDAASTIYEEINPGNSVNGKLVFDVPKGTNLTKLELHDSAFSGGVEVDLEG